MQHWLENTLLQCPQRVPQIALQQQQKAVRLSANKVLMREFMTSFIALPPHIQCYCRDEPWNAFETPSFTSCKRLLISSRSKSNCPRSEQSVSRIACQLLTDVNLVSTAREIGITSMGIPNAPWRITTRRTRNPLSPIVEMPSRMFYFSLPFVLE